MAQEHGINEPITIYQVSLTRSDKELDSSDRLNTVIGFAKDSIDACRVILGMSRITDEAIDDHALRSANVDAPQLCGRLADLTGEEFDVSPFEVDPRFPM